MHDVIKSCIEALQQGEECLNFIDDAAYVKIVRPLFISSSGEHMRHILDHFTALKNNINIGLIDYDKRDRGSDLEKDKSLALHHISTLKKWLLNLDETRLSQPLLIKTEVALTKTCSVEVESTLARELVFAASHAVHHYSTIAIVIQMQEIEIDKNFGIAPATASYLRGDKKCVRSPG